MFEIRSAMWNVIVKEAWQTKVVDAAAASDDDVEACYLQPGQPGTTDDSSRWS